MRDYKQSYRGSGSSQSTTTNTQPEMEIVLNKQEVIYTDSNDDKYLTTRVQTNNRIYWIHDGKILDNSDSLEEMYRIVNRDSKINTILSNELG